jgi:hypothetical protein
MRLQSYSAAVAIEEWMHPGRAMVQGGDAHQTVIQ